MIGRTISHYKILEKLGEGGMGVVYKAEDTTLRRAVALKFLPVALTREPEARERLAREAQAAAALNHPNICTIHEIDEVEGQTFIAMEHVEGETLRARIRSAPLDIGEALDMAAQVAEGLAEAHAKGIVHRDIKPANIMITDAGRVKIMDFGLARTAGCGQLTKTGTTVGTVAYMSPEQARGAALDHRTDIWSLGVVLYEMLAGKRPFKGDHDQAVIYSILNEEPRAVSSIRPGVAAGLERILTGMLSKSPSSRYQTAQEIVTDLRADMDESESPTLISRAAGSGSPPSIAVMPFVDMSPGKDQEYFCDGMAEELINTLTKIRDLKVVARTSAFSFKGKTMDVREIGRRLNVEKVLEGSVRKSGNKLRITAQLINVADGYHVWSEKFDRDMEDIFAIQDEISLAIVDNLEITLLKKEEEALLKRYTEDLEAYNLYLKGIYFLRMYTAEGFQEAIRHFEQALQEDPNYALAYYGLAEVFYAISYWANVPPHDAYPQAKEYARKAIEIDEDIGEAHAALGLVYTF